MSRKLQLVATIFATLFIAGCINTNTATDVVETSTNATESINNTTQNETAVNETGPTANETSSIEPPQNTTDATNLTNITEPIFVEEYPDDPELPHKWALFVALGASGAGDRLGNGSVNLAKDFTEMLVADYGFPRQHCTILFDDGNYSTGGTGDSRTGLNPSQYEGATKANIAKALDKIIEQSNKYADSEVIINFQSHGANGVWLSGSGAATGHPLSSTIAIWPSTYNSYDDQLWDYELAQMLAPMQAKKVWLMADSCMSGGFADKLILGIDSPVASGCVHDTWIVTTGASLATFGYSAGEKGPSTDSYGHILTFLMYDGLRTGKADGYKEVALGKSLVPTETDRKVSVEEMFYYGTSHVTWAKDTVNDFKNLTYYRIGGEPETQPQMNDKWDGEMFL